MTIHTPESETQIYGQGFRSYTGPRRAPSRAVWTLWAYTCGRVLGRRRRFRYKLVPIFSALIVWGWMVIVIVGTWFFSTFDFGSVAWDFALVRAFYRVALWGIFLLAVRIPSRILSEDRSGGLFALYMISPISRIRYVFAQSSAILTVMVLLFLPAMLFMLLLFWLLGSETSGMDFLNFLWRIPVGSIAIALVPAAIGMIGGSLAAKGRVGVLLTTALFWVPTAVLGIFNSTRGIPEEYYLLSPFHLPYGMGRYVFGHEGEASGFEILGNLPSQWVVLANLAWAAAGFVFVWWASRKWTENR